MYNDSADKTAASVSAPAASVSDEEKDAHGLDQRVPDCCRASCDVAETQRLQTCTTPAYYSTIVAWR